MNNDNIVINKKKFFIIIFVIIILLAISIIIISFLFNKFNDKINNLKSLEQENADSQLVCYKLYKNNNTAIIISSFKNDTLLDIRSIYTINYDNNYSVKNEDYEKFVNNCKNDLVNKKVLNCDVYDNDNSIRLYNHYDGNSSNIESNILDYTKSDMTCQQYKIK